MLNHESHIQAYELSNANADVSAVGSLYCVAKQSIDPLYMRPTQPQEDVSGRRQGRALQLFSGLTLTC